MKKLCFMLTMMMFVLVCCSDGGENPIEPTLQPDRTEIIIDSGIVTNGLSLGASEGEQTITFSVNADWTLSIASTTSGTSWCKASTTSGSKGTANVKFTVTENTDYEDRSVSVTIKSGSVSKTFTITQKAADALLVSAAKYEVAQEGGRIEIEVKANISYQMGISETAKSWITEASGRALTTNIHKLDIAMNEEIENREGEITFTSGDKVETVKVYQAGGTIILLSQNECFVDDAGETISVDVKSNVEYGVQMPDVDWITDEASSRGMSSHTLQYVVVPNEGYDSRSAEIIFYDKNSELKDTLKVVQAQKDAIVIAEKQYDMLSAGGNLDFKVSSNVDFKVEIEGEWIKQATSRGLTEKSLYFDVAENTNDDSREGKIILTGENVRQEIAVKQNGKTSFAISSQTVEVGSEKETFQLTVTSNIGYKVEPNVDWIKEIKSKATGNYVHTFEVSTNPTTKARKGVIVVCNDEEVCIPVTVIQKGGGNAPVWENDYNFGNK